jgi:hypothetical protein
VRYSPTSWGRYTFTSLFKELKCATPQQVGDATLSLHYLKNSSALLPNLLGTLHFQFIILKNSSALLPNKLGTLHFQFIVLKNSAAFLPNRAANVKIILQSATRKTEKFTFF